MKLIHDPHLHTHKNTGESILKEIRDVDSETSDRKLSFNRIPNYVIGCLGIGDIICSFNALENMGIEQNRIVNIYSDRKDCFNKLQTIFNNLQTTHLKLHLTDFRHLGNMEVDYTIFQAFGMEVSWVNGWLKGWQVDRRGYEHMIRYVGTIKKHNKIGMSFTVNHNPTKNPSRECIRKIIKENVESNLVYFGYIGNEQDKWIQYEFGDKVEIFDRDLQKTIDGIRSCTKFIGADSGMAWLATYEKIPTKIVVGKGFGKELPKTFSEIPWVNVEWEI
jgi:hypothetical protein